MSHDSRPETYEHIAEVRNHLMPVVCDLLERANTHDHSKLVEPELSVFNEFTPMLTESAYGSVEYHAHLAEMSVGLRHHYTCNDHHPEHHPEGMAGMDLVQVLEMLADWKAATLRMTDGDLLTSIEENATRFLYSDELKRLLVNTATRFGWL